MAAITRNFTEETATEAVLQRNEGCSDARLREIMAVLVPHLHAVVRELRLTPEEWLAAISFLTRTGQLSSDRRQEFILLSDTLGVSMLVDAINNRKIDDVTPSTVLGPFYVRGAPAMQMGDTIALHGRGEPLFVSGRLCDEAGQPIAGAELDVWQTSEDGFYDTQDETQPDMNLRGVFHTGADGRFWFRSIVPASYPIPSDGPVGDMLSALRRHPMRPAHIHFILRAPGYDTLTTHIFIDGDPYLDSDAVFGVKDSLIVPLVDATPEERAGHGLPEGCKALSIDFRLQPEAMTHLAGAPEAAQDSGARP
ncbi:MAG: intradiol ring-cleavage dioxygenase [Proteobacteria bacterium]|nr:intradiol ring-cleavage dioxygenase [Pseudomonadota bacterium]